MLRSFPHLEDLNATAGGDSTGLRSGMAKPQMGLTGDWRNPGSPPPGEDGITRGRGGRPLFPDDELENHAAGATEESMLGDDAYDDDEEEELPDFLHMVRSAEDQALMYVAQANRRGWSQSYRAFHQEHFVGSKYTKSEWRNRSKIFRPKTRSAIRKDMAAVAASMFNNIDAINCLPGDEGDPKQRGAAGVMEELVNYRTNRSSGKAALPWFLVALGARQNSLLSGICLSKQTWKLELRKLKDEEFEEAQEDGSSMRRQREVWVPEIDRPDSQLIPPENFVMDPAADWTDPAQSAAYIIIKWPMHIDEIVQKQNHPQNPWNKVSEDVLQTSVEAGKWDMAAIRRSRESGLDRYDETQTGTVFQIVWVYEVFMRWQGEDYTFFSVSDREYLTDPKPVREVYPEQFGERPLTMGYGSLEAHRIFPMSPVESWQQHQVELNDIANLTLDALKQNVMPVTKVVRGRNIDLDQVKRRSYGSAIMVQDEKDLTFERPPDIPQSVAMMTRDLELEFDDLAGQFNGQTAENSNALSRTLGGLKLVSGTANAVQEYDIRVWIETWVAPTLTQIVRLEQYYESDPVVLGICGNKAQLFQKHGISKIDDDLLEQDITIQVSAGLGAGDPQQRLMKFQSAASIAVPLLQGTPEFQSGAYQLNVEAVMEEIFGAAGYRDGGMRFLKKGPPKPNPLGDLPAQKIQSEIEKNQNMGKGALLTGLSKVAQVNLGDKQLEADRTNSLLGAQLDAHKMGFEHAHKHMDQHLSALDHGTRHALDIKDHHLKVAAHNLAAQGQAHEQAMGAADQAMAQDQQQHQQGMDKATLAADQAAASATGGAGGASDQGASTPSSPPQEAAPATSEAPPASSQPPAAAQPPGIGREVPLPSGAGAAPVAPAAPAPAPQAVKAPEPKPVEAKEAKLSDKLSELIELMKRPKKVVRDGRGKITGVEHAQ